MYCSIAELYMTDLCDYPSAETAACTCVETALKVSPPNMPDAYQAGCNLRLSQNRGYEGCVMINAAYKMMEEGVQIQASGGDGELSEQQMKAVEALPDYAFRTQTGKLLIECASGVEGVSDEERNEMGQKAVQVLGSCMAENDEIVETWFLLGCAFMSTEVRYSDRDSDSAATAQRHASRTRRRHACLCTLHLMLYLSPPTDDPDEHDSYPWPRISFD